MRILVDGIPKEIGGIGTLIINLINYNEYIGERNNIVFEFLVPTESEYIDILKNKGYRYFEVTKVLTRGYRRCVNEIFRNNQYDYVWINNTSKVNIYLPITAKRRGTSVIVHSHGVQTEEKGVKRIVFDIIEFFRGKRYCELIDIPFACSKSSAEYFYPRYLIDSCTIISNGIDNDRFKFDSQYRNEIRESLNLNDEDILLGASGRLTQVKNHAFLIKLMISLPDNYKLVILGDGEEKSNYESLIDSLGLEHRVFLPGNQKKVERYLSAMDIFLMPSLNEGLPFSLVEAQSNGLKCIVSTGVSQEARLLATTKFISLENQQVWIDEILSGVTPLSERQSANEVVAEEGYSIEVSYNKFANCILNT